MLVITMVKYHEHGNLKMTIKVPRNPVLDYMTQASIAVKDYLSNGWHITHACVE